MKLKEQFKKLEEYLDIDYYGFTYKDKDEPNSFKCENKDCKWYQSITEDSTGIKTSFYNYVKGQIKGKANSKAVNLAKEFLTYILSKFVLPIALVFGGVGVASNVIVANENVSKQNLIKVYGDVEVEKDNYSEAVPENQNESQTETQNNIDATNNQEGINGTIQEEYEEKDAWLLKIHNNSSAMEASTTYWDYCNNEHDYTFPYDASLVDNSYSLVTNGGLASFCEQYPCSPNIIGIWDGNVNYQLRPIDLSKIYDENLDHNNIRYSYVVFAKITYVEIDGKWYLASDEACSMTPDEVFDYRD